MMFFFFQAEDGIRDYKVTGVQTCTLPISASLLGKSESVARCIPPASLPFRSDRPHRSLVAQSTAGWSRCSPRKRAGVVAVHFAHSRAILNRTRVLLGYRWR